MNLILAVSAVPLVKVLLVLIIVGFALWLVNQYVPMAPPFKATLNVIVVVLLLLWLLTLLDLSPIAIRF